MINGTQKAAHTQISVEEHLRTSFEGPDREFPDREIVERRIRHLSGERTRLRYEEGRDFEAASDVNLNSRPDARTAMRLTPERCKYFARGGQARGRRPRAIFQVR
jgi:hypothetical protein